MPLYRYLRTHKASNYKDDGSFKMKGSFAGTYKDHFYSLSASIPANYSSEGIACRVWKSPVQLPDALLRISEPGPNKQWAKGSTQTIGWEIWTGGGFVRVSYSTNGGQSWSTIAPAVPVAQNYGVAVNGSYVWPLPATLAGSVRIKLDWISSPDHTPIPWASAQSGDVGVGTQHVVPINPKRK